MKGLERITLQFGAVIFLVVGFAGSSTAWDNETFKMLVQDSIQLAPSGLKVFLESRKKDVLYGVGWTHGYQLRSRYDPHHAPDPYKQTATLLNEESSAIILELKKEKPDWYWVAQRMGVVAHYIGDILRPARIAPGETTVHTQSMFNNYHTFIMYEGYQIIEDYSSIVEQWRNWLSMMEKRDSLDTLIYNAAVNAVINSWSTIWHKGGRLNHLPLMTKNYIHYKKWDMELRHLPPDEQLEVNRLRANLEKDKGIDKLKRLEPEREDADKRVRDAYSSSYSYQEFAKRLDERRKISNRADEIVYETKEAISRELANPITYHTDYDTTSGPSLKSTVQLLEFSLKVVRTHAKGYGRIFNNTAVKSDQVVLQLTLFDKKGQVLSQRNVSLLRDPLGSREIRSFNIEFPSAPFEKYSHALQIKFDNQSKSTK